jgi:hypothetical protein
MAYSTATEIREWLVNFAETQRLTDTVIDQRIAQADEIIKVDLSNSLDFDVIDAAATVPSFVNLLSEYKSCELVLFYLNGVNRGDSLPGDIEYFMKMYNSLVNDIKDGKTDTGDYGTSVSVYEYNYKNDVRPPLGTDKYGEFETENDMESYRPLDD